MTAAPNILILMLDQLNGVFFPDGPANFLHAPVLKQLSKTGACTICHTTINKQVQ